MSSTISTSMSSCVLDKNIAGKGMNGKALYHRSIAKSFMVYREIYHMVQTIEVWHALRWICWCVGTVPHMPKNFKLLKHNSAQHDAEAAPQYVHERAMRNCVAMFLSFTSFWSDHVKHIQNQSFWEYPPQFVFDFQDTNLVIQHWLWRSGRTNMRMMWVGSSQDRREGWARPCMSILRQHLPFE